MTVLAYAASAWIIAAYFVTARTGRPRPFHWANAVGCVPLIASGVLLGAWPQVVLTVLFGGVGIYGLVARPRSPRCSDGSLHHDFAGHARCPDCGWAGWIQP